MPKIVDQEQRRAELAAAVFRVVERAGVEGASVRVVAAEAGWSMGALRYYFSTQEGLLRFAVEAMAQRVSDRVTGHYLPGSTTPPGIERAAALLLGMLPVDEERRAEVLVWLAFMTRARIDPTLDDVRREGWTGEAVICRLAVAEATGTPLPNGDPLDFRLPTEALEAEARRVQVVVDGLSLQGSTHPEYVTPDDVRAAVRELLLEVRARHAR